MNKGSKKPNPHCGHEASKAQLIKRLAQYLPRTKHQGWDSNPAWRGPPELCLLFPLPLTFHSNNKAPDHRQVLNSMHGAIYRMGTQ